MNDPKRLQQAIRDLHGLDSEHLASRPVHEVFQGKTVWEGNVEVFRVRGHPETALAYAWTYTDDAGVLQHVAVLGVAPINNAQDAVRAYVMAQIGQKQGKQNTG